MSRSGNLNSVFYAETYHPIQAGSIDGTDTTPHDNGVSRALLCSSAALYDPFGDPKVIGDPYCTVFVGHLSHSTTEHSLLKAMSKYGRVKNSRLVRHIVTGASRGYAFVEYETEREMRRAYKDAHHSFIDDSEVIVDYCRQLLMPGWVPRRLGGGLGGRKESGQLRFGGRERPFRAPLQQIPYDDLKRLGIPPPPEGKYMSRFEVPSPPRRKRGSADEEDDFQQRSPLGEQECSRRSSSVEEQRRKRRSHNDREERHDKRHSVERKRHRERGSREDEYQERISVSREKHLDRSTVDEDELYYERSSRNGEDSYDKHRRHGHKSERRSSGSSTSRRRSLDHDRISDH